MRISCHSENCDSDDFTRFPWLVQRELHFRGRLFLFKSTLYVKRKFFSGALYPCDCHLWLTLDKLKIFFPMMILLVIISE